MLWDTYRLGYYLAAGWRASYSGSFASVTTNGFYWTATQRNAHSASPNFNSNNIFLVDGSNRVNGQSVRCVAAF